MKTVQNLQELEQLREAHETIGFYFSTPTCGVCHTWRPQIEQAFDPLDLTLVHIDLTVLPAVTGEFMVMGVPTLVIQYQRKEQFRFGAYDRIYEMVERVERFLEQVGD